MFLEKFSRYVRQYNFDFHARHKYAPRLSIVGKDSEYSILDALKTAIAKNKALIVQPNSDIIELMRVSETADKQALVLLFHKAAPNAADPMYRKRARAGKMSVRPATSDPDEEQSVSAHLIISINEQQDCRHSVVLEEIPGMSMNLLRQVIARVLHDYEYEFTDKRGNEKSTYCVIKATGIRSETLTNALKSGSAKFVTLVRPPRAGFVDSDEFSPEYEQMKIRIKKEISAEKWKEKLGNLARSAREAGWEDFQVAIRMDDERNKTIQIDRGEEAKEILFVRSEQVSVKNELNACSLDINVELVESARKVIQ